MISWNNACLGLACRRGDHEAVEIFAHLDLAGKSRIRLNFKRKVEHVFFHRRWLAHLFAPSLIDIDVAGRARAGAAAFRLDLRHPVVDRRLHHRGTSLALDCPRGPCGIDEGDFDHDVGTDRDFGLVRHRQVLRDCGATFYRLAECCASGVFAVGNQWSSAQPPNNQSRRAVIAALASRPHAMSFERASLI